MNNSNLTISSCLNGITSRVGRYPLRLTDAADISKEVIAKQAPLVGNHLTSFEFDAIAKYQEAVGRLIVFSTEYQAVMATCSAVGISPNGFFLTGEHCVNLPFPLNGFPKVFILDVPVLSKYSSDVLFNRYEVEVIDYDSSSDLALLAIKHPSQDPIQFIKLKYDSTTSLGDSSYKLGHLGGLTINFLSSGNFVHLNKKYCSNKTNVISTAVNSFGDSGGALVNANGDLIGILSGSSDCSDLDYSGGEEVREIVSSNHLFSCAISVSKTVLPFLEKILGVRELYNLLDGKEVASSIMAEKKS